MNFYVKKPGKKVTSDKPIVPVYELDRTNRKRHPYTKFGQNRTLCSKVIAFTDTYIHTYIYIYINKNLNDYYFWLPGTSKQTSIVAPALSRAMRPSVKAHFFNENSLKGNKSKSFNSGFLMSTRPNLQKLYPYLH